MADDGSRWCGVSVPGSPVNAASPIWTAWCNAPVPGGLLLPKSTIGALIMPLLRMPDMLVLWSKSLTSFILCSTYRVKQMVMGFILISEREHWSACQEREHCRK